MKHGETNNLEYRSPERFLADFAYLAENWPNKVLDNFYTALDRKTELPKQQPYVGYKSKKYSKYRRTIVAHFYILIYTVKKESIVIHRLKHASLS